jgi:hypothetical protein
MTNEAREHCHTLNVDLDILFVEVPKFFAHYF